jgi:hypothetical protein
MTAPEMTSSTNRIRDAARGDGQEREVGEPRPTRAERAGDREQRADGEREEAPGGTGTPRTVA